jgi:hypothetical protein
MCREECGRQADADELVNCFIPYPAAMQTCRPCALGFWGTDLLQGQVSTGCEIPDRTLTGWEAGLFLKGTQVLFRYQPAYRFVQMEGASR